jgi:hypothetical protein
MMLVLHFLESFDVQDQIQAFIQVMPDLMKRAPEWKAILHSRIINDEIGLSVLEAKLRLMDEQERLAIQRSLTVAINNQTPNQAVRRFLEKTIPAARWLSEAEASSKRSQLMSLQVDFFKGIA